MAEDEVLKAKKKAMALLQHNDRTEWELNDKLQRAGFSEYAVNEAIEYVRSFHYIDDERYARRFVEIYRESRSIKRLRQDLYKRHVDDAYISLAVEAIDNDDSIALNKAVNKLVSPDKEYTYEEKQKIAAKLYRKGFSMGDIFDVLNM